MKAPPIFLVMPAAEIQLLRTDHAPALLVFERENRAWFAATIPDRGDAYFEHFDDRVAANLAEQDAGVCYFHVLLAPTGEILGRINLMDAVDGSASLGYRIAQHAAGQGLATWAVRELFALAATRYALTTLRAATTVDNAASQTVLTRTGFILTGETRLSGHPGLTYTRSLADFAPAR